MGPMIVDNIPTNPYPSVIGNNNLINTSKWLVDEIGVDGWVHQVDKVRVGFDISSPINYKLKLVG